MFRLLAILSNTAVNVHVHVLSEPVFSFLLGTYPGVELLRYCPAVFQNSCSIFHSHQQCKRVQLLYILTNACYYLIFFFFFFGHTNCRILVPQSGSEPWPQHWKAGVLTAGLRGESPNFLILGTLEGMRWYLIASFSD